MKRIVVVLFIIIGFTAVYAQERAFDNRQPAAVNMSLQWKAADLATSSQNIMFPEGYMPPQPVERTSFQKGVGISTDVLVTVLPIAAATGSIISGDWKGLKQLSYTIVASTAANFILKYTVRELRPDHSNYHSFPSLHSTVAFGSAGYLQRRYGWKIGAPAYAVATYVAVGRVVAKKHHWWDCVAGAAIGAGSAYLFTTPWARKHEFSMAPVASEEYMGFATQITF